MKILKSEIVKNICWLVLDKLIILVLQFFIGVKIANYYGKNIYGDYSYIVAIASFSSIFFELINGRVVKKYYLYHDRNEVMYNFTTFRVLVSIFLLLVFLILGKWIELKINSYLFLIFLMSENIFINLTSGIENYYEYNFEVKKIVIANNIVKILSYILQYLGILLNLSILMVPIIRCLGSITRMLILRLFYFCEYRSKNTYTLNKKLIYNLIKDSFFLWASFVAFIVYTQVDKVMIGILLEKSDVGVYNISIQLSTVLMLGIGPVQTILFSKMLELYKHDYKEYINYYLKTNFYLTQFYIFGAISSIIVVKKVFLHIFDVEYIGAVNAYIILSIGAVIKANGALQTGHMTLKNITKRSFYKTFIGVFINVLLNYILIIKYGINGAALATSITQILTLFLIDFFIKEYREQAVIQLRSFNIFYMIKFLGGKNVQK